MLKHPAPGFCRVWTLDIAPLSVIASQAKDLNVWRIAGSAVCSRLDVVKRKHCRDGFTTALTEAAAHGYLLRSGRFRLLRGIAATHEAIKLDLGLCACTHTDVARGIRSSKRAKGFKVGRPDKGLWLWNEINCSQIIFLLHRSFSSGEEVTATEGATVAGVVYPIVSASRIPSSSGGKGGLMISTTGPMIVTQSLRSMSW